MTDLDDLTPVELDGWEFTSAPATEALSFSMQAGERQTVPIWRVDLAPDPQQADGYFSRRTAQLRESQVVLESVSQRLDRIAVSRQGSGGADLSFDVAAAGLPEPEAELLRLLEAIKMREAPLSFSTGATQAGRLDRAGEQFRVASQRLLRLFSHFAWVDTLVQGQLLGRTEVGWTGSMNTAWAERLSETQINLHRRNLEVALASRNTSLRTLTVSIQTAAKLSVLLATPGGAILALPVAWKFVNQILAQARLN